MKKNYQLKVVTTWNPAKKEVLNLFEGTGTDVISCDGDLWEVTFDENLEGYPLQDVIDELLEENIAGLATIEII